MFGSYTDTSSRCLCQVFLVDQQLDVLYGLSIPNAYAFITEEIDGSDVMIASTSGDVVSSGGVRLSPSESTNADIRKAYSYLTSDKTNGMSISALENQTEVSRFYFPFLVYIPC
jgi:hypothetical protein